jgi:hypothetical protein
MTTTKTITKPKCADCSTVGNVCRDSDSVERCTPCSYAHFTGRKV